MDSREALALLRRIVRQIQHATARSCKSGELLTWVSKDRLERWAREIVDTTRILNREQPRAGRATEPPPEDDLEPQPEAGAKRRLPD